MDQQLAPIESNNQSGENQGTHGFLVAAFILAGIPILGLIFTIIANKQSKQRGKNRELALIALISSIITHAVIVLYILAIGLVLFPLTSQSTDEGTDSFNDLYEYGIDIEESESEGESLFDSPFFNDDY